MYALFCAVCINVHAPTISQFDLTTVPNGFNHPYGLENTDSYQNGSKQKKGVKQKQTSKGRSNYRYTSIGPAVSMRNTHNLQSRVAAGPVEFDAADGASRLSGSDITLNTSELWNSGAIQGVKLNYGQVQKKKHFFKVSLSLLQGGQGITSNGGNEAILPIDMNSPWLGQLDYTWGRAFKAFGTMAYAGANISAASYNTNMSGWHRPENYTPREKVSDYPFTISELALPPRLRKRQVGIGVDIGAMLVSYNYSPNNWIGLEWNSTAGVFMRDAYVSTSLNLVYR